MPLTKPYPPVEIDYEDWEDLADNYAGKAAIVPAEERVHRASIAGHIQDTERGTLFLRALPPFRR